MHLLFKVSCAVFLWKHQSYLWSKVREDSAAPTKETGAAVLLGPSLVLLREVLSSFDSSLRKSCKSTMLILTNTGKPFICKFGTILKFSYVIH